MKKIVALILTLSLCFSTALMSGCMSKNEVSSQAESSAAANESKNNTGGVDEIASDMTTAVINKDYKTILTLMDLNGENSFVTEDDIAFQLPRSNYSELLNVKDVAEIETKIVDKSKTSTYAKAYKKNGSGEPTPLADITLNLDDNNNWVVSSEEFVNENFSFRGPSGNVTVTVNGKDITNNATVIKKTKTGDTGMCTDYTIPKVGKKNIKVNVKCENYNFTKEIATAGNNQISDDTEAFYDLKDNEKEAITTYIKNTWNALYKDWESGKKSTDETQYISDKADIDILKTAWDGFDKLTKPSATSSKGNDNFKMEKVLINNEASTSYLTDNVILVNFKYELHWHYKLADWNQQTRRLSHIFLEKTKDGYKIYDIGDTKLFTEANSFTKEWN